MTKKDFLKNFVTSKRVKLETGIRDDYRKVFHVVLANGWKMPVSLLTALKGRLFPAETEIEIPEDVDFVFDTAMVITYPNGQIKINARALHVVR
jgi:hypothetical protein